MQINWRSPALRLAPASVNFLSRLSLLRRTSRPASFTKSFKVSSGILPVGSKLNLRVSSKITGSCGINVMLSLNSWRLILEVSTLSIFITPLYSSMIRDSANPIVDFPAPVLPTTPTFIPGSTSNEIFLRTKSVSGRYLTSTPSKDICPEEGQSLGAPLAISTS